MNAILYLGLAYWPRWLAWLSAPEIDYTVSIDQRVSNAAVRGIIVYVLCVCCVLSV